VRRLPAFILIAALLLLGTGGLEFAHNLEHAAIDSHRAASSPDDQPRPAPVHNENNCEFHARLHLPVTLADSAPLLLYFEKLVALHVEHVSLLISQRAIDHCHCRGPPPHITSLFLLA
jgi:hypothetical protein